MIRDMKTLILALCTSLSVTAQPVALNNSPAIQPTALAIPVFSLQEAFSTDQVHTDFVPNGKWRGVFRFNDSTQVPFNFELTGSGERDAKVYFINGPERLEGGRWIIQGDSLYIYSDQFDNEMAFGIASGPMAGTWRKQNGPGVVLPVVIQKGVEERFTQRTRIAEQDISGTYAVTIKTTSGKEEQAVAIFDQEGSKLRASFLRVSGDSRYLDGIIDGNRFQLSSFIGSGPSYYTGTIDQMGIIRGAIIGTKTVQPFEAKPDESAALPDPYKLTFLREGYTKLDFSFPGLDGKQVSLKDDRFKGKVVIVTIGGTWCPNCMDEAAFLSPWYKKNRGRGVEIIGLQYERKLDSAYLQRVISRFRDRFDIGYTQLVAGLSDGKSVMASLPALNSFLSFPTTIFIDKRGQVAKIHTGFSGPATGRFYDQFVEEFNATVDELLKQ